MTNKVKQLLQVKNNYLCAGLVIENEVVVEAAPILKYMIGWTCSRVMGYCTYKNWEYEICGKEKESS